MTTTTSQAQQRLYLSLLLLLTLLLSTSVSAWLISPLVRRVTLLRLGRSSSLHATSGDGLDAFRERLEDYYQLTDTLDMADFEDNDTEEEEEWTVDTMQACDEECEEGCLIPGDMRVLPDFAKDLDVMAFLGIQRAEPLKKKVDWE